jgi:hypothetical protein
MRNTQFTTSIFVVTVLMGASAWAVHTRGPGEVDATIPEVTGSTGGGPFPAFGELDADGDRRLTLEEAAPVETLSRQFEAADINQDGAIDPSEFSAFETTEGVMPGIDGAGSRAPEPAGPMR